MGGGAYMNTTLEPDHIDQLLNDDDTEIKPYLRPMSSMTEEESKQFLDYIGLDSVDSVEDGYIRIVERSLIDLDLPYKAVDWLNVYHFDYRGLIKKVLAIAVTKENNPYK